MIELELFCNEHNVDILGLSETWCKNTHTDRLLKIDSLPKLFRRDRNDRIGGGLALYATDDINIRRLNEYEPTDSEIMCFEFQLPNKYNKFVFLCLCYRPQDRNIMDFCADLLDIHDSIQDKDYYNIMYMGDFNSKHTDWCSTDRTNIEGSILKAVLDQNGYNQLVNFPTRFDTVNNRSSCLDFIITNGASFVDNIQKYGPIANCDHIPVTFNVDAKTPKLKCYKRHVWNFKKGDFVKLNDLISNYPWDNIFNFDDINDVVDTWTDVFLDLAKECIPYYTQRLQLNHLIYLT